MKTMQKILAILVIGVCVFAIMPQNISMAASSKAADIVGGVEAKEPEDNLSQGLQLTIGRLLGFLQVASGLIAILMIAITGFNYIVATPDVKEEMKKKMLPIIIGLVIVFGAVSIAKFILGTVNLS